MERLFSNFKLKILKEIGDHIQKTELFASVIGKNQTKKKLITIKLRFSNRKTTFLSQRINVAGGKN
jgi:hypothetical protein